MKIYYVRIGNESIKAAMNNSSPRRTVGAAWKDIKHLAKENPRSKFSILQVEVTTVPKIPRRP